jgi:hypothetical protein
MEFSYCWADINSASKVSIVNGVAPTVLIGAYRFPNDGDLDALDAAAKASYVKSAFSMEPIVFGKWRD